MNVPKKMKRFLYGTYQGIIFILFLPLIFFLIPFSLTSRFLRKYLGKKPRILWAPTPIINIHYNSKADRLFGYKSDTIVYSNYIITESSLFTYNLEKIFNNHFFYFFTPHIFVFIWAVLRYDIFHFFYNQGLLFPSGIAHSLELPILRLMGKKIIVSAYGSDIRTEEVTRNLGKYHFYYDYSHEEVLRDIGPDLKIKKRVKHVLKYANVALSAYDMIEYTPGSKNDVFYWAIDTNEWQPVYNPENKKVVILHATNQKKYKGTRFLLEIIKRIKEEGYPIEYIFVEKSINKEAKELYKKADIIAEQFLGGSHGFFAVEAMALGKPVLTYLAKKEYLPYWKECPIVNTSIENLYENLIMLIKNKELRQELGKKGRKYIEEVYSLEKVGERFNKIYKEIW